MSAAPLPGYEAVSTDLARLLAAWSAPDPAQERLRQEYLAHLARHPDAAAKGGPPAHVTAGCLVVDEAGEHVLLTLHRKLGRWVQMGGHLEPGDESVAGSALREAREESGLDDLLRLLPGPVQLDRHALGGGFARCREHLDLRWVAVAPTGAPPVVSEESLDVAWWPVDALPADTEPAVADLVATAVSLVTPRRA
ncbi:NUDIX hydrolase [Janibacter alkaliphilus]|uniref:8-oxo-dGTP pyrophosphatase MutT (NUDIX family) n=1 Tax=Janibacter alkaliphilus TaxID=1069963 RepID=A0A852XFP1_9MICO|nr:8-oxo-dGTP pyrophosphatase MutT (NUDIX family) [Janibacter alkaliphilus]